MFIIRVVFYLLDGIMDSSFLISLHLGLTLCSVFVFFKQLRVFGVSNQAFKIMSHLSSGSLMAYFVLLSLFDFGFIDAWEWHRYHVIPMIICISSVLLQIIMLIGGTHNKLHKTLTRIPLLLALVVLAWGSKWADQFTLVLLALSISLVMFMKSQRFQKRVLLKMYLFLVLVLVISPWSLLIGELFFLAVIFYFSIFQNAFCIQDLLRNKRVNS